MKSKWLIRGAVLVLVVGVIAYFVWSGYTTMLDGDGFRQHRAKLDIKALDTAASAFKTNYGDWPDKLEALTKPHEADAPIVADARSLIDPWGRAYRYDRNQRHPKTGYPLIWSDGSNPATPHGKISNWGDGF